MRGIKSSLYGTFGCLLLFLLQLVGKKCKMEIKFGISHDIEMQEFFCSLSSSLAFFPK